MLNFRTFDVLTFDCYGTLIDWEAGILDVLRGLRGDYGIEADDADLLEKYAWAELHVERAHYRPYKDVLREVMRKVAGFYGIGAGFDENALVAALPTWRPYPDTVAALAALKRRFRLAVISNIDDDLFTETARQLEVPFDWVITAEQAGAYKPAQRVFRFALRTMGVPMQSVLHVARSLYHDIRPANDMGWSSVWVNRRRRTLEAAATRGTLSAVPDLEVPDLAAFVRAVERQLQEWDA